MSCRFHLYYSGLTHHATCSSFQGGKVLNVSESVQTLPGIKNSANLGSRRFLSSRSF